MRAKIIKKFDQLEIAREKLISKMSEYSNETLNTPPKANKWSPVQILYHVNLAEQGTLSYIKYKIEKAQGFEKMTLKQYFSSFLLKIALRGPVKWKAPANISDIPTDLNFNSLADEFKSNRENWRSFLNEVPEELIDKAIFRHPISGRMNLDKTLEFLKDHSDRHYGQIRRILT